MCGTGHDSAGVTAMWWDSMQAWGAVDTCGFFRTDRKGK